MSASVDERTVTIRGQVYRWMGGFGSILESRERDVKPGDVRFIGERLFYAYMVHEPWPHVPFGSFRTPVVCWTLPKPTIEEIDTIRKELFQ